jgi:CO/xanthine dehydrogenase Mo-binding subunit
MERMSDAGRGRREPYIGRAMPRFEDRRLVAGRGRFADDAAAPGQIHAAFVRSPHAHARIDGIDADAAKLPGVLAVITAADYAAAGGRGIAHMPTPTTSSCAPSLDRGRGRPSTRRIRRSPRIACAMSASRWRW